MPSVDWLTDWLSFFCLLTLLLAHIHTHSLTYSLACLLLTFLLSCLPTCLLAHLYQSLLRNRPSGCTNCMGASKARVLAWWAMTRCDRVFVTIFCSYDDLWDSTSTGDAKEVLLGFSARRPHISMQLVATGAAEGNSEIPCYRRSQFELPQRIFPVFLALAGVFPEAPIWKDFSPDAKRLRELGWVLYRGHKLTSRNQVLGREARKLRFQESRLWKWNFWNLTSN